VADPVGQAPHDDGEEAPGEAEDSDEVAELLVAQAEVFHHRGEERGDDPAVKTDEAKAEAEECDGFPFVGCVPLLRFGHS